MKRVDFIAYEEYHQIPGAPSPKIEANIGKRKNIVSGEILKGI